MFNYIFDNFRLAKYEFAKNVCNLKICIILDIVGCNQSIRAAK